VGRNNKLTEIGGVGVREVLFGEFGLFSHEGESREREEVDE